MTYEDIIDPAFDLANTIIDPVTTDNSYYLYIGIGIVVIFIGLFAYKFYMNKSTENGPDCPGGFCNNNYAEND